MTFEELIKLQSDIKSQQAQLVTTTGRTTNRSILVDLYVFVYFITSLSLPYAGSESHLIYLEWCRRGGAGSRRTARQRELAYGIRDIILPKEFIDPSINSRHQFEQSNYTRDAIYGGSTVASRVSDVLLVTSHGTGQTGRRR